MSNKPPSQIEPDYPLVYQFRLAGHLDQRWVDWFDGLKIALDEHGQTILSGEIKDQAELQGVLKKIYNLGLKLISVNPIEGNKKIKAKKSNGEK